MSFVFIDNNNFEYSGVKLSPRVKIISSSIGLGSTGSVKVHPNQISSFKELFPSNFDANGDGIVSISEGLGGAIFSPIGVNESIKNKYQNNGSAFDYSSLYTLYMDIVNSANVVSKYEKSIDIFRFDQPVNFNSNRNIKNNIRKVLMPFHKHRYQNCDFSYTNYNTLNFVKNDTFPTGSALLYPNSASVYDISDKFSLNFWINPRYSDPGEYQVGTIFHLSSSIAVSIFSGSSKDETNAASDFKILLQLSQSADTPPSSVDINLSSPYPNDLIFTSSHTLSKNNWHNVHIQWSKDYNNSTGSIFIDNNRTDFHIPSSSIGAPSNNSPAGIVIGNYFNEETATFGNILNETVGAKQGFYGMSAGSDPVFTETMFNHALNAEIHEIKLFNKVFFEEDRKKIMNKGVKNFNNLIFYLPPFFYPKSPTYDVIQTPFEKTSTTTDDPFNVAFSFGVNGKLINLQNFTRDFANGIYPRNLQMEPETINSTIQDITADQYVYSSGSILKRNMLILPNDNGLFSPDYSIFANEVVSSSIKFKMDNDSIIDYSIVKLEDLVASSSLYPGLIFEGGEIFDKIVGASPENPGVNPGSVLTIAQRTRDLSSNEITVFDITNLYYGNRINPETFTLYDSGLTGSEGKVKIRLRDNGLGSLYRADALTKHAKWNNVGNVLYDEGIVVVKSPHLFYFCKDRTEAEFRGDQNIHTMMLNVPVYANMFNSSSNPTFQQIAPSTAASDTELNTIYVTTVNIHDENFNIIMKANLSQPIIKTDEDEFIIRLKEDF